MLTILWLWLATELAYAVAQRTFVARRGFQSAGLNRLADVLFEPLSNEVVTSDPVPFRARDVAHATHGGVYAPGAVVEIELSPASSPLAPLPVQPLVRRVCFDPIARRPMLAAAARWDGVVLDSQGCRVRGALPQDPGMYVLEFANPTGVRVALSLYVSAASTTAPVVILPTFTVWGYHRTSGFYPGHGRPDADRWLAMIGRMGMVGRALVLTCRVAAKRLFGVHVNQPSWPVHARVRLDSYFETNHRWMKGIWDRELARLEGVWNDDIDILIPFFALADAHGIAFRIASDLDVHRQEDWLMRAAHWIFVGQESLTARYWAHLEQFAAAGGGITLWCPQGFGYRQVEYDETAHCLSYVCSRGTRGFWNEPLEAVDPPWDESKVFGFRFPSPDSVEATNPHRVQYDALVVQTPLGGSTGPQIPPGTVVKFPLWANGAWRPGLNWMGGEPFRRVIPEAAIHVHMAGDREVIGFGTFRNTAVVSPTFLGALWAYGAEQSLVEAVFRGVVAAGMPRSETDRVAVGT